MNLQDMSAGGVKRNHLTGICIRFIGPILRFIKSILTDTDGLAKLDMLKKLYKLTRWLPVKLRQTYSKKYLHSDEEPFFVSGENSISLSGNQANIALAICYEISIPEHSENAYKNGAGIYIASVAKTKNGVEKAIDTLSHIARKYSMTVLMSNSVGYCDNFYSAGNTSAWNIQGELLGQLNDTDAGILIIDTETMELIERTI